MHRKRSRETYALVIGVDRYETDALPPLRYAVADALEVKEFLKGRLGLAEENCLTLATGVRAPRRGAVLEALDRLAHAPMGAEDLLVVFFAGHGFSLAQRHYLLTEDSRTTSEPMLRDTAVAVDVLGRDYLPRIGAGRVLMVLDACQERSGSGRGAAAEAVDIGALCRDAGLGAPGRAVEGVRGQETAVLSSCWEGQKAYEYPERRHGWFCWNFLEVLRAAPGGRLDLGPAVERVGETMRERAWRELPLAVEQRPHLLVRGGGVFSLELEADPERGPQPVPEPDAVVVRPYEVGALRVEVRAKEAAPVPALPGLPPLSAGILACEGILAGLAEALGELASGTHPSLREAQAQVEGAAEQARRLREDLERNRPTGLAGREPAFRAELEKDGLKLKGLAALCRLAPEVPPEEVLRYVKRLRNTLEAERLQEGTKAEYERARQTLASDLAGKAEEEQGRLRRLQEEELGQILDRAFEAAGVVEEIPVDVLLRLQGGLEKRRYPWSGVELVERMEAAHAAWVEKAAARAREEAERQRKAEEEARLAAELREAAARKAGQVWADPVAGVELVWMPPGRFQRESGEVTLSRGFWLGKYPVTQGQWEAVMGSNPSYFKAAGKDAPVEQVSWDDCQEFLRKLNGKAGQELYRLPTEAEWEYACRAGTTGDRYGDVDSVAWYDQNSGNTTHPVGQKQANAWGLHDMLGNVWEWCADWYGDYPSGPVTDPRGPSSGSDRVDRGGGWSSFASLCRSAFRDRGTPDFRFNYLGFRLARGQ